MFELFEYYCVFIFNICFIIISFFFKIFPFRFHLFVFIFCTTFSTTFLLFQATFLILVKCKFSFNILFYLSFKLSKWFLIVLLNNNAIAQYYIYLGENTQWKLTIHNTWQVCDMFNSFNSFPSAPSTRRSMNKVWRYGHIYCCLVNFCRWTLVISKWNPCILEFDVRVKDFPTQI